MVPFDYAQGDTSPAKEAMPAWSPSTAPRVTPSQASRSPGKSVVMAANAPSQDAKST
jgi:hypothetical protein